MMIQHTVFTLMLSVIWPQLIFAQLTAPPPGSKCSPLLAGFNRPGCSINTDCVCHSVNTNGGVGVFSDGMCASNQISCSVLTPCENDRKTCKQPETICVQEQRCSDRPVCYPIALANSAICPPTPPANHTIITEPESEIPVCKHAIWGNGQVVAGGGTGFELYQLQYAEDFIVDGNRNIYIADRGNHRIVKWSPNATTGELLAGGRGAGLAREQLNNPTSILLTTTKDLIICDSNNRRIQRWSQNANYGETVISGVACYKLFTGQNGEILFSTDKNEIFKWLPVENRTELVMKAGGKNPPSSKSNMFLSRNGNVYVADAGNNRILKYIPGQDDAYIIAGGQPQQSSALDHLNEPSAVVVDAKGTLYITDGGNRRIVRWMVGETKGVILNNEFLNAPNAIHFDGNGNLYASDYSRAIRYPIDTSACSREEIDALLAGLGSTIG